MTAHESWHVNDPLDKRCPHAEPQADSQLHGVCVFCWRDRAGAIRAHLTTENEALKKELASRPVARRVEGRVVAATFNDDNVTLCVECPEDTEVRAGPCTITLHDAAREEEEGK